MNFPKFEEIIGFNRRQIEKYGGFFYSPDNLHNRDALMYLLDAIQYPLNDTDLFPTFEEKAAVLAWKIITGHVFHDGNKRTGIHTMDIFIRSNDYELHATNDELIEVSLKIAKSSIQGYSYEEFLEWIMIRVRPV